MPGIAIWMLFTFPLNLNLSLYFLCWSFLLSNKDSKFTREDSESRELIYVTRNAKMLYNRQNTRRGPNLK